MTAAVGDRGPRKGAYAKGASSGGIKPTTFRLRAQLLDLLRREQRRVRRPPGGSGRIAGQHQQLSEGQKTARENRGGDERIDQEKHAAADRKRAAGRRGTDLRGVQDESRRQQQFLPSRGSGKR